MAGQRAWLRGVAWGAALGAIGACSSVALAYKRSSPEVKALIDRAMPYLEEASDDRPGGMAVVGLALIKNKAPFDHPKVVEAVKAIQASLTSPSETGALEMDVYSNGLCLIFFVTLDPTTYSREIQILMRSLVAKQKPHGGWGYPDSQLGDSSMTQYGVLSTWEAQQAGYKMPFRSIEAVCDWLIRSQDPSGAWGYQGKASPTYQLIRQDGVRHSMTAAALGSTYICADLLGLTPEPKARDEGVPSALQELTQREPAAVARKRQPVQTSIDIGLLRAAQQRGDAWIEKNFKIEQPEHTLYYMYALERYCSFRELAEGRANYDPDKVEGPAWYNAGVDYLRKTQGADGTWNTGCGKPVDTGFGVLFLLRSTHGRIAAVEGFGSGLLVAGQGLPEDGDILVQGDRVVQQTSQNAFDQLRGALDRDDSNAEALAAAAERISQLGPKESQLLVSEYRKRIDALRSDPDPDRRAAAVKVLGYSDDMDNVPLLILALDDPDLEVVRTARDGLRRISRKPNGFGLSDDPSDIDRARAIEKWKAWYLSLRPDAEF